MSVGLAQIEKFGTKLSIAMGKVPKLHLKLHARISICNSRSRDHSSSAIIQVTRVRTRTVPPEEVLHRDDRLSRRCQLESARETRAKTEGGRECCSESKIAVDWTCEIEETAI